MPTLPKKARALLQKARATLYNFPQTPVGHKLKKQLATKEALEQLEELIGKEAEGLQRAYAISHPSHPSPPSQYPKQESPLVTDEEHARALIEEKIKPALQEVLHPATKAKEPRIFLQRGDNSIRDHLIATASPTQLILSGASVLYQLLVQRSPVGALKSLAYDLAFQEAMARMRSFIAQYDKLTNTITCKAIPEEVFLFCMTHEYVHFYQAHHSFDTPRIGLSKLLSEGHAEASADAALRWLEEQGKLDDREAKIRRDYTFNHLMKTYEHLCAKTGRKSFTGITFDKPPTVYDDGFTLFRLAEEKNGKDVYARMLIGDVAALKI